MAVPPLSERGVRVGNSDGGPRTMGRRTALKLLAALPSGIAAGLSVACSEPAVPTVVGGPQGVRELRVDLSEPLGLPGEPKDDVVRIRETVGGKAGYVIAEEGSDKKPIVSYVDGDGKRTVLNKEVEPNTLLLNYSLSPNGKMVALAFVRDTEKRGNYTFIVPDHVEMVDLASGRKTVLEKDTRLYEEPGNGPGVNTGLGWSPDSRYFSCNLFSSIWDTASGRSVYANKQVLNFSWSPKENKVLMSTREGIYDSLQIVDFTSGEKFSLGRFRLSGETRRSIEGYVWSGDGERGAIISKDTTDNRHKLAIQVVDKKGRQIRSFTAFEAGFEELYVFQPALSPNGQYLVLYVRKDYSESYLVAFEVNSGKRVIIPTHPQRKDFSEIAEDINAILFTDNNTLFMTAPSITRLGRANQPTEHAIQKALFLNVSDLLNGQVNFIEGRWGSGRAIELIKGSVEGSPYRQPDGSIMITVKSDGKYQLFRIDPANKVAKPEGTAFAKMETGKSSSSEKEVAEVREGDVLVIEDEGNRAYRMVHGKLYPIEGEFAMFMQKSGVRRQPIQVRAQSIGNIPQAQLSEEPNILDWLGYGRRNNRRGGQKNILVPGVGTETNLSDVFINPDTTFPSIMDSLVREGWGVKDTLNHTYNPDKKPYDIIDTMRDPLASTALLSRLMTEWEEAHPLDNFNIIGHSLGGLIALHAAYEHLGRINNLIIIDSPIWGLPPSPGLEDNRLLLQLFGEKVYTFLRKIWGNEVYQKRVREILAAFRDWETGFFPFTSTDDIIVPVQSASVEGLKAVIKGKSIRLVWPMGKSWNPFDNNRYGHGEPLKNEELREDIRQILGRNLAAAG